MGTVTFTIMALCSRVFARCNYVSTNLLKLRSTIPAGYQLHRTIYLSKQLQDRFFTEQHEWIDVEGGIGTVGVTDYAQSALGDVVYAQLPDPDTELEQMDDCGALESVKAASELFCPVTGVVTEKNENVEETPGLINKFPYEQGWLFKLKLTKPETRGSDGRSRLSEPFEEQRINKFTCVCRLLKCGANGSRIVNFQNSIVYGTW